MQLLHVEAEVSCQERKQSGKENGSGRVGDHVGFSLSRASQLRDDWMSSPGVYAFLPTKMVTNFPFIIQADFLLASSRETILLGNKWNKGILDCVPFAFINALVSLIRTSENAPVSSLAPMFKFIPVNSSSYKKLNIVWESIKAKLLEENIVPSESYA